MKKIILFSFFMLSLSSFAQSLGYVDGAILFSMDDQFGTARYTGMSGAFGALGGDMSAVDYNPAGLAVFNKMDFQMTMSYRNTDNQARFYGPTISNRDDYFRFSQAGAAIPFNSYGNSGFVKFAIGFNYSVQKDFNGSFFVQGNSGVPDFVDDPFLNYDDDPTNNVYYVNVDEQRFSNYTSGLNDRFVFSFATQYKDFLYLGASVTTNHIGYYQRASFVEYNNDGNDNLLDAYLDQYLDVYGYGTSVGVGAIIKPIPNFRIGLSYQSPTWYNMTEQFVENLEIVLTNTTDIYRENKDPNYYDYGITTPSRFTGSMAYVFGGYGLISFDYSYKNYDGILLKPSADFVYENQDISQNLQGASSFKIGTEWRYNIFSIRGGYRFEQSPYKISLDSEDLTGYSVGLGFKFSDFIKLDLAYDNYSRGYQYGFLNIDGVDPAYIDQSNSRFTSTLIMNF